MRHSSRFGIELFTRSSDTLERCSAIGRQDVASRSSAAFEPAVFEVGEPCAGKEKSRTEGHVFDDHTARRKRADIWLRSGSEHGEEQQWPHALDLLRVLTPGKHRKPLKPVLAISVWRRLNARRLFGAPRAGHLLMCRIGTSLANSPLQARRRRPGERGGCASRRAARRP